MNLKDLETSELLKLKLAVDLEVSRRQNIKLNLGVVPVEAGTYWCPELGSKRSNGGQRIGLLRARTRHGKLLLHSLLPDGNLSGIHWRVPYNKLFELQSLNPNNRLGLGFAQYEGGWHRVSVLKYLDWKNETYATVQWEDGTQSDVKASLENLVLDCMLDIRS